MGFPCSKVQQIHSTISEYFCRNTPDTFLTGPLLFLLLIKTWDGWGGRRRREWGWNEEGGWGRGLNLSCCMSHGICSRARCYFVVFPFILQSKEYPRNVRGNPTRKFVGKEVCKEKKQHGTKGKAMKEWREWWGLPKSSISPSADSKFKVLIGMNVGLVTQLNLDISVRDESVIDVCVCCDVVTVWSYESKPSLNS